jgi:hypothetical protein
LLGLELGLIDALGFDGGRRRERRGDSRSFGDVGDFGCSNVSDTFREVDSCTRLLHQTKD